jgi:hypothetical protein
MELNKRGANPNTDNSSFEIIIIIKKMFRGRRSQQPIFQGIFVQINL